MALNVNALKAALRTKKKTQGDLARASDWISLGHLSSVLSGYVKPSAELERRLRYGLIKLNVSEFEIASIFDEEGEDDRDFCA